MKPWVWAPVLLLLGAGTITPYVRSRVNGSTDPATHCLRWPEGTVAFSQSTAGDPGVSNPQAAVSTALGTWQTVMNECGGLVLQELAQSTNRQIGYDPSATNNLNLVLFRTRACADVVPANDPCIAKMSCANAYDCWSNDYARGTIALTTTTYSQSTGLLYDADMELNAADFYFTVVASPPCPDNMPSQSCVAFDVQNTTTHEFGHALGLAHSLDPASTMYASAPYGQTSKRVLDTGSRQFVCDTYPKGQSSVDCVTDNAAVTGGCSAAQASFSGSALLLLGLFGAHRRGLRCRGSA